VEVLAFGSGDMSQLGLGHEESMRERKKPTLVKPLSTAGVRSVAVGALHNAIILESGAVWAWGCNDDAALGRDGDEWYPAPVYGKLGRGIGGSRPQQKDKKPAAKKAKKNEASDTADSAAMETEATSSTADDAKKSEQDADDGGPPPGGDASESEDEPEEDEIDDGSEERAVQVECGASHTIALTDSHHVHFWQSPRIFLAHSFCCFCSLYVVAVFLGHVPRREWNYWLQ
jgi:alpha-tubulin suppressor-like RCC1 family protein